jgi:hypothetical protein
VFFKTRNKKRGEDLNRKVERYKRWWQDRTQGFSFEPSNPSEKNKHKQKPFDSSFVYYDEG